jgi:hypothetical protein
MGHYHSGQGLDRGRSASDPGAGLTAARGVSFDHLTSVGVDNLSPFSRLGSGAYSPLCVG